MAKCLGKTDYLGRIGCYGTWKAALAVPAVCKKQILSSFQIPRILLRSVPFKIAAVCWRTLSAKGNVFLLLLA